VATSLAGQRALVTGAASGIGAATVAAMEQAGALVVGLDREFEGGDNHRIHVDVSQADDVNRAITQACAIAGKFDILVNAAGIYGESLLSELDIADYERIFAVNVRGTLLVTKAVLVYLDDGARIINVASELAFLGRASASVYAASKGAILSLTRSWARELAPRIRVNAVAPGPTDTPLLNFGNLNADQRALELANPLGRIGRPEEIAAAILFLASREATFVTGHCLCVDGGSAMR
jgi:3-oxoacyl-[acyl-carrier protein] reductase